jgi:hypothetical protein
MHPVSDDV